MCNMERIGLMVSEEMSFENVDGRTMDACIYYKLTYGGGGGGGGGGGERGLGGIGFGRSGLTEK